MKIVFLSSDMCDGGAQRVIATISQYLAQDGNDVYLLIFSKSDRDYPIGNKVKVEYMCQNYEEYKQISEINRTKYIRKYLKKVQPDVGVGFLQAGYALYVASLGMRFVKVASLRNAPESFNTSVSVRSLLSKIWFKRATTVILQTNAQKKFADENGWHNTVVIGNPINESLCDVENHVYRSDLKKIIMAGRLTKQKNYFMAIRAIDILAQQDTNVELHIYGVGEEKTALEKMINDRNLSDKVFLDGWNDNILKELSQYDLYMMTSNHEGMPNALMEAMAKGLPCISTDCPTGPSDLIENDKTGWLIPMNDEAALADTIIKVTNMPLEDRKEIGMAAQRYIIENYNGKVISQKWKNHFENLLNG